MKDTYYHGSYDENLTKIDPRAGIFNGLFFADDIDTAESHGKHVYKIELDDSEIADHADLIHADDYAHDDELIASLILEEVNFWRLDEEEQEKVRDILGCDDNGEADWEIQRLRGQYAKKLGFKAVKMRDEHGTTYLVVAELELKKCKITYVLGA